MHKITIDPELEFLRCEALRIAARLHLRDRITLRLAPGSYSYVDNNEPTTVYLSIWQARRLGAVRVLAHELRHVQQFTSGRLRVASEQGGTWAWWDGEMHRLEDSNDWPWERDAAAFEAAYCMSCA